MRGNVADCACKQNKLDGRAAFFSPVFLNAGQDEATNAFYT